LDLLHWMSGADGELSLPPTEPASRAGPATAAGRAHVERQYRGSGSSISPIERRPPWHLS